MNLLRHLTCLLAISAAAAPAARALPPASHSYSFSRAAGLSDELGGPAMTPIAGALSGSSFTFPKGGGLSVTGAVPTSTYSIEFMATLAPPAASEGAFRLLDFQNGKTDSGLYYYLGRLMFYNGAVILGTAPVNFGTKYDLVITRDATSGIVTLYLGGRPQFAFQDRGNDAVFTTADGSHSIARFFKDDDQYPNEDGAGSVDRIRIFDTPLTDADAAALAHNQMPPNVTQR